MHEGRRDDVLIIKRRGGGHSDGHHGGVWKIAFADFMTAMMAFFLVLWIVNSTSKETRSSIARFFNPVKLADTTPARKGLRDAKESDFDAAADQKDAEKPRPAPAKPEAGAGADRAPAAPPADVGRKPVVDEARLAENPQGALGEIAGDASPMTDGPATAASPRTATFQDPFEPVAPRPGVAVLARPSPPPAPKAGEKAPTGAVAMDAAGEGVAEARRLRAEIARAFVDVFGARPKPEIEVRREEEGVLISLTDSLRFEMFAVGSSEPHPKLIAAMGEVAAILSRRPGVFVVRGHTDSRPWRGGSDNWRLSTSRAHVALEMLRRGGFDPRRLLRLEGYADRAPRNSADPRAPENRRIEILLREAAP